MPSSGISAVIFLRIVSRVVQLAAMDDRTAKKIKEYCCEAESVKRNIRELERPNIARRKIQACRVGILFVGSCKNVTEMPVPLVRRH